MTKTSEKFGVGGGFSKRLECELEKKSITQKKLAEMLDVKPQSVSNWIVGKNLPSIPLLDKTAEILDVSVEYLLCNTDIKSRKIEDRQIGDDLKISDTAIQNLRRLYDKNIHVKLPSLDLLNYFLENPLFYALLEKVCLYKLNAAEFIKNGSDDYALFGIQKEFIKLVEAYSEIDRVRVLLQSKQKPLFDTTKGGKKNGSDF